MNPAICETIKMLAGVANAERISFENKDIANQILIKLLKIVEKDVNLASLEASGIITAA
jgi:hypothetical protein